MRTFRYRLYPTAAQEQRMFQVLNVCRHFHNMCLEDRKLAYELEGRTVKKSDQEKMAIRYRQSIPLAQNVFSQTLQTVIDDLDKAYKAFFRRVKAGEKPGYPRFKSRNRFHSFAFKQFGVGARLDGRHLKLFGIGKIPVRWHRPIEGTIKTARITYQGCSWYACFCCELPDKPELPKTDNTIALDLNITNLFTDSKGQKVDNPAFYRLAQAKLRILQRSLQRKKKGSKNRQKALGRVQRQHQHIKNQRADTMHKLTHALVQQNDRIACEDLRINNMARNHHLSKSIMDAGWGIFKQFLTYKAEDAGRQVMFVNPANTSKCCSNCGKEFQDFNLSTRWVQCRCDLSLDRDHNAAINILKKTGWDTSVQPNAAPLPPPYPGDKSKRAVEATQLQL